MVAPTSQLERRWLRTPQAAEAIGVSPKLLGRWIERGVLTDFRLAGPNLWKLFSLRDLASLCLVPALSDLGVPLHQAGAWSHALFSHISLSQRDPIVSEAAFLVSACKGWFIAIWREGEELKHDFINFDGTSAPPASQFSVIHAGRILADCFDRALAMTERPYKGRPPRA